MATVQSLNFAARVETRRFRRGLGRVERDLSKVGRQVGAISKRVAQATTAAFIGMSTIALREFAKIETAIAQIGTRTGRSGEDIAGNFTRALSQIRRATGVEGERIADTLQKSISAGLSDGIAVELTLRGAQFEAAGLGEAAAVASTATTLMTAFGDAALSASRSVDIVARTAQIGEGDVADYASAFKSSAGLANLFGVSIDELSAALAENSKVAATVTTAGTQVEAFLRTFAGPPQKVAVAALEEVGLTFDQLRETIRTEGISGALREIEDAFGGSVEKLSQVFTRVEALQFVANVSSEGLANSADVIRSSSSVIDDAFSNIAKTLGFRLNVIRETWADEMTRVGSRISEVLSEQNIFGGLQAVIPRIGDLTVALVENMISLGQVLYENRRIIANVIAAWALWRATLIATAVGTAASSAVGAAHAGIVALRAVIVAQVAATRTAAGATAAYGGVMLGLRAAAIGTAAAIGAVFRAPLVIGAAVIASIAVVVRNFEDVKIAAISLGSLVVSAFGGILSQARDLFVNAGRLLIEIVTDVADTAADIILGALTFDPSRIAGSLGNFTDSSYAEILLTPSAETQQFAKRVEESGKVIGDAAVRIGKSVADDVRAAIDYGTAKFEAVEFEVEIPPFEVPGVDLPEFGISLPPGAGPADIQVPEIPDIESEAEPDKDRERSIAQKTVDGLLGTLESAFARGDFSGLGKALVSTISSVLAEALFSSLGDLLGNFLGGGGGGGFAGLFHQGGIVPGSRGQTVPILAQAGEAVLTIPQQQQLMQQSGVNVTLNVNGDLDRATMRSLRRNAREVGNIAQAHLAERRLIA